MAICILLVSSTFVLKVRKPGAETVTYSSLAEVRGFQAMAPFHAFRTITFLAFSTTRFLYVAFGQEVFSIIREPKDSNSRAQWTHLDYFIPPSLDYSRSGTTSGCSAYNAYADVSGDCLCQCTYRKATFGFYSGMWTCLKNTELRNRTGCKYKFEFEYANNYPLKIVDPHEKHNVILPSKRCSVEPKSTRYFTCDGRWAEIDSHSLFSISCTKKLESNYKYELEIESDDVDDDLLGRIINLGINCGNRGRSCLLFKLEGTLECPENVTSVTTAKPLPTTMKPTSDRTIPTTTAKTTAATAAAATVNATGTVTESAIDAAAIANYDGNKGKMKAEKGGLSSTVVGVVVTLVIIVVMVIMIVAYVYRKRKRGESVWHADLIFFSARKTRSTQQKRKNIDKIPEEPEYAEIPEEQQRTNEPVDQAAGIYSYAFDDPQTAYTAPQQAPYNRLVHNPRGTEEEGAIYSTADDGPVYNVLERLPSENQIMMVPESTMNEGPPSQTHEPEYYVLEGHDADIN